MKKKGPDQLPFDGSRSGEWSWLRPLLMFLFLTFTACLDLSIKGKVSSDGRIQMDIHLSAVDQVLQNAIEESAEGAEGFPLFQKKTLVKRLTKLGGFLKSYKNEIKNGVRTVDLSIELLHPENLDSLQLLDFMHLVYHEEDKSWVWSFGDMPLATALGGMEQTSLLQQIELLAPILKGMKLNIELEVPEILETKLVNTSNSQANYRIDFDTQVTNLDSQGRLIYYEKLLQPKYMKIGGLPAPQPPKVEPEKK